ncbi:hypothetical protein Fmac_003851 [Flemingia macrophylla]|uniref:Uncharacterized protein n=1 Tax=Flemingia macrophylla TaxID=520843 RepID=A0ABD1N386_9FABA
MLPSPFQSTIMHPKSFIDGGIWCGYCEKGLSTRNGFRLQQGGSSPLHISNGGNYDDHEIS